MFEEIRDDSRQATSDQPNSSPNSGPEEIPNKSNTKESSVEIASVDENLSTVFGLAGEDTARRLSPWMDDVYKKSIDFNDEMVGVYLVQIDRDMLQSQLLRSYRDRSANSGVSTGPSESDFILEIGPNFEHRSFTRRFSEGSTGFANFKLGIVSDSLSSQDHFRLEISPDGQIFGSGRVGGNYFNIRTTPEPNVLVVAELDGEKINKNFRLD